MEPARYGDDHGVRLIDRLSPIGRRVSKAHRLGLVNEVVEPDQLMPRAQALAAQLVANSRSLVGRMRRSLITCRLDQLATQQAAKQGDAEAHQTRRVGGAPNRPCGAAIRTTMKAEKTATETSTPPTRKFAAC